MESKKMNTIELFCGTKSFSKVAAGKGYSTFTIDNEKRFDPTMIADINKLNVAQFRRDYFNILWASPPCDTFSTASISTHWTGGFREYIPKTEKCIKALELIDKTIRIIKELNPKKWYIENPRGVLRKVIDDAFMLHRITDYRRVTVTYCQYGDNRMKPTDIWTNDFTWKPRKMCKNGDKCHVAAPRGSKTGTQGLKNKIERGIVPKELIEEILKEVKK